LSGANPKIIKIESGISCVELAKKNKNRDAVDLLNDFI